MLDLNNSKTVKIKGRIDASNYNEHREALLKKIPSDKDVILDLEELDFIDSSGLGVLVKLHKTLDVNEQKLYIVNLNYKIRLVFEITRANRMFDIFESMEDLSRLSA